MSKRTWFRCMVAALCLHYWADAGRDLVDSDGALYDWIHMILACAIVPAVIGSAWRYSRGDRRQL